MKFFASTRRVAAFSLALAAGATAPFGCAADSGTQAATQLQTASSGGSGQGSSSGAGGEGTGGATGVLVEDESDGGRSITVGQDAAVCQQDDLPVKVPGCSCTPGTEDRACWTGPAEDRNKGQCKDGVQKCIGQGEFSTWGPCEGEVHLCEWPGETLDAGTPEGGPPPGCGCIPGVTISCDEDCETLVICSLTGTKTCQPDGTWAPCRETFDIANAVGLIGCRNWLHGCFAPGAEGFYTGDCAAAFTCGKAPGQP